MYLIEVQEDNEGEKENEEGMSKEEDEVEESNPQISVHAIHGISSGGYKTMRVTEMQCSPVNFGQNFSKSKEYLYTCPQPIILRLMDKRKW